MGQKLTWPESVETSVLPQTADIAKLRAIISEAIYSLSTTEGSEPLGARQPTQVGLFFF
jgi:hypothetical protein